MKMTGSELESKVDELLVVLDEDIRHIKRTLSQLNELRASVVKRDDVALGRLLESVQVESDSYRNSELRRESIRKELALALDCDLEQFTLSRLEAALEQEKRADVMRVKTALRTLVEELKKEHFSTILLLSECARFNSQLLQSVFGFGKTEILTYDSSGSTRRRPDMGFVNLHF